MDRDDVIRHANIDTLVTDGAPRTGLRTVTISTVPVELDAAIRTKPLEEQIQDVADHVSQMIMKAIDRKPQPSAKAPGSN